MKTFLYALTAALLLLCQPVAQAAEDVVLWQALASRQAVALMRHTVAPGIGDPPEFSLGNCSSQRLLSASGRQQARQNGERFRRHGIDQAQVFSSQWCRCLETAKLLELGEVRELPILNSFFSRPEQREQQTRALQDWLGQSSFPAPVVLVTHQVNITALTGIVPASGEIVVLQRSGDELTVLGRIAPE